MIRLTRLNETSFVLNSSLLKFIEERPDTIITLVNEEKVVVRESADEVVDRIIDYERRLRVIPGS